MAVVVVALPFSTAPVVSVITPCALKLEIL
jgi:hypothetical protein